MEHLFKNCTQTCRRARCQFRLGRGPLLGLGEGGPQFDRKGSMSQMRNGQDGYRLRTHGGRVPIRSIVGTDGWGLYVHDRWVCSISLARLDASPPHCSPRSACSTSRRTIPRTILREYAAITGFAELPARWTFGYMQSHRTLAGVDEKYWGSRVPFREKQLPCDALISIRKRERERERLIEIEEDEEIEK